MKQMTTNLRGPGEIRTPNRLCAKQLLYRWSYKPIAYYKFQSRREDLNLQSRAPKARALPNYATPSC